MLDHLRAHRSGRSVAVRERWYHVFVRFPCNGSGVRVAVVATSKEADKVRRRFGYAISSWTEKPYR